MRRGSIFSVRAAWIAALLLVLFAVSASAQYQAGNIYGKTVAKDGTALPGVTVIGGALLGAASPDQVAQSAVEAVDRIAPTGPVPGEIRLDITDAILRWEAIQG